MNVKKLNESEVSVLSGRIDNPRVPPKSKKEAKEHLKQIETLRKYERQLMALEAAKQKEKREQLDFSMKEWEEILPEFDSKRNDPRTVEVWKHYSLPAPYRGNIWKRVLGNPGELSEEGYRIVLRKAKDRQKAAREASETAAGSPTGQVPIDEQMRRLLDEDPNYFSPVSGKDESANLIAVDLPRTIITRNSSDGAGHRRVDSSINSSSHTTSPRTSPTRRSMDGAGSDDSGSRGGGGREFSASPCTPAGQIKGGGGGGGGASVSPGSSSLEGGGGANMSFTGTLAFQGQTAPVSSGFSTTTLIEAMGQDGKLVNRLETCLRCFVEFRPDMGYVQGMSYLAAMLLMNLSDRDAFIALSSLLTRGHFPYFYTVNHQGMSAHISIFEQVVRAGAPDVARNLTIIGVMPQMYVCDWWMSMFSRSLPYEICARCWDLYLLDEAYLYRISFCLLMYFSEVIHEYAELDEVMSFLSKLQGQVIDEDKFFHLVHDPKLSPSLTEIRGFMKDCLLILGKISVDSPTTRNPATGGHSRTISASTVGSPGNSRPGSYNAEAIGGSGRSADSPSFPTTNPEP